MLRTFSLLLLLLLLLVPASSNGISPALSPAASLSPTDPAGQLQKTVDAAISSGQDELTIPEGEYNFGNRTFAIFQAKDLLIKAAGPVSFIFYAHFGGVLIRECTNVTFVGGAGWSLDRKPPPYAQVTVTAITADQVTFHLDNGTQDPRLLTPGPDPSGGGGDHGASGTISPIVWIYDAIDPGVLPPNLMKGACPSLDHTKVQHVSGDSYTWATGCPEASVGDALLMFVWKGFSWSTSNSSAITVEDLTVYASGYTSVFEGDGGGGHVYRRLKLVPKPGRLISCNADGLHTSDVDVAPTIEDSHFANLLDDYYNFQTTLLLAIGSDYYDYGGESTDPNTFLLVHPHVSDQSIALNVPRDEWYGTTEPLSRVGAGEELIFYDPITFEEMGRATTALRAEDLPATADTALGKKADALYNLLLQGPGCNQPPPPSSSSLDDGNVAAQPPLLMPAGCYLSDRPATYKFSPGNLFPAAPHHGVKVVDSAAQCCTLCQSYKNCTFWNYEHGGTDTQPTCYSQAGGCCFLRTAAAWPGAPASTAGSDDVTSGSTKPFPICMPYDFRAATKQDYPLQKFRSSVYRITLTGPPPVQRKAGSAAAIPYIVQIAKTMSTQAHIKNSIFENSNGFFGRWKSSNGVLESNTFRGNVVTQELEMLYLPTFYEGPIVLSNVSILNNSFEVKSGSVPNNNVSLLYYLPPNHTGIVSKGNKLVNRPH